MPNYDANSLDTTTVASSDRWYNWSVVDAVRNDVTGNFNAITMVLGDPSPHSSYSVIALYSKEAYVYTTDYSPILTVHWTGFVPEFPSLLTLSLLMMGTLLAIVFYKRSACGKIFL
jgi:ABC-type multidrug transport system permease subunit